MSKCIHQQCLTKDHYKDANRCDMRIEPQRCFSMNPYGWYDWVFDTLIHLPVDAKVLEMGSSSAASQVRPGEIFITKVPRLFEAVKEEHS